MKMVQLLFGLLLMQCFIPLPIDAASKILLVNSDVSIAKYQHAMLAFSDSVKTAELKTLDLAAGKFEENSSRLEELIRQEQPELIYAIGAQAYEQVRKSRSNVDIIFSSLLNWRRLPIKGHTWGIAGELPPKMEVMLFRHLFPDMEKIGVLYCSKINSKLLAEASRAAAGVNLQFIGQKLSQGQNLEESLALLLPQVEALWLMADPKVLSSRQAIQTIFDKAQALDKPVFSYSEVFEPFGPTLIISTDQPTVGRQAAALAAMIRAGDKPATKVQFPAGSRVILNPNKAQKFGLKVNPNAMSSVNRIME